MIWILSCDGSVCWCGAFVEEIHCGGLKRFGMDRPESLWICMEIDLASN